MPASSHIGFNGMVHEPGTRWQLLGNGRRAFNPVLMRFHSPDQLSPFARGGINAYAYCGNDPINLSDPSGQSPLIAAAAVATAAAAKAKVASAGVSAISANAWSVRPNIGSAQAGASWAQRVAGSSVAAPAANRVPAVQMPVAAPANARTARPPAPSSPVKHATALSRLPKMPAGQAPVPPRVWHDEHDYANVSMSDLDEIVRKRVMDIRTFAPGGSKPAGTREWLGKKFTNPGGRVKPLDRTGDYYHTFPISFGTGHGYENWRIIVGGTRQKINTIRLTWDHYETNVQIKDWGTYQLR